MPQYLHGKPGNPVSPRELEALQHAALGRRDIEIARAMGISGTRVRQLLVRAVTKLEAQDRTHAVYRALSRGIIPKEEDNPAA